MVMSRKESILTFKLFDDVRIKGIKTDGFIDRIEQSINGTLYRVVYWWDGVRNESWMYSNEIEGV